MAINLKRLRLDMPADIRDVDDNFQKLLLDQQRQDEEFAAQSPGTSTRLIDEHNIDEDSHADIRALLSEKVHAGPFNTFDLPVSSPLFVAGGEKPVYSKDFLGFVHLFGYIYKASNGGLIDADIAIATLPVGFRPREATYGIGTALRSSGSLSWGTPVAILIDSNGVILRKKPCYTGQTFDLEGAVRLDGISFLAAQ